MSIEAYTMRTLLVENFVDILEMRIKRRLLIDIVLVMDDVGTYIQEHAWEVLWVLHMIDVGDDQDNIVIQIYKVRNNN